MSLIDKVRIFAKAGDGGAGAISFFRGPGLPKGGPDGGNGGNGGDVYVVGNNQLNTLWSFRFSKKFVVPNGTNGSQCHCHGAKSHDIYIPVPFGTLVHIMRPNHVESIDVLDDIPRLILKGGRGGIGNGNLANSVDQTPYRNIPFGIGEEAYLNLELKMLADIGLVGLPNAGKSSFINSCTNANSLVGDYAFTTLEPVLGTYKTDTEHVKIVDIPGIIERASIGIGLGLTFLEHISRCKLLVYLVDVNEDPLNALRVLENEFKTYNKEHNIAKKPYMIVLNKIELVKKHRWKALFHTIQTLYGVEVMAISIKQKAGIKKVLNKMLSLYSRYKSTE